MLELSKSPRKFGLWIRCIGVYFQRITLRTWINTSELEQLFLRYWERVSLADCLSVIVQRPTVVGRDVNEQIHPGDALRAPVDLDPFAFVEERIGERTPP